MSEPCVAPAPAFWGEVAGAAVAVIRLEERGGVAPTPEDRGDAGSRSGAVRDRFFRRRAALRHFLAARLSLQPGSVVVAERRVVERGPARLSLQPGSVVVAYDGNGAPRLLRPAAAAHLSVSGRGEWAAFALARDPVGIDLEPFEDAAPVWSALSRAEAEALRGEPEAGRAGLFLRAWTAKEAVLKARGIGLLQDPATVEIVWRSGGTFSVRGLDGIGQTFELHRQPSTLVVSVWCAGG